MGSKWVELDRELPFPGALAVVLCVVPAFATAGVQLDVRTWDSVPGAFSNPKVLPFVLLRCAAVQSGWTGVVHSYTPTVQNGGIEDLTMAFE